MKVYDPVCGMRLESSVAAAHVAYADSEYFFCASGCKERFEHDPGRFLDPDDASMPGSETEVQTLPASHGTKPCPYCGDDTDVGREAPAIGTLSLNEFEAMVRSGWRHRLGRRAYRRHHPRKLIRALLTYALDARSTRENELEEQLTEELARLRVAGLARSQIQRELFHLSHVIWKVLHESGIPLEQATTVMATIDGKLLTALEWKANDWDDPWRFPG